MSAGVPARPEAELTGAERQLLEEAHAELRKAATAYDQYVAALLRPGETPTPIPRGELAAAQRRIELAENRLWQLRERLLGWERPPWAPPASEVTDWFSPEDAVYDQLGGVWAD